MVLMCEFFVRVCGLQEILRLEKIQILCDAGGVRHYIMECRLENWKSVNWNRQTNVNFEKEVILSILSYTIVPL